MPAPSVTVVKRTLDIAGALAGLALTLPLYPAIALAIRADSPGPTFFKQKRACGLHDAGPTGVRFKQFEMLKFRTMCHNAEASTGAVFSSANDSRVTRVGAFLRKTRLDEIPQFINVLKGEMSLIGPRPERVELLDKLVLAIPYFEERLREVKPGITGLAQIRLSYTGRIPPGSELEPYKQTLLNPYDLEEAEGALADDLRAKLIYDVAYAASLEKFTSYVLLELEILLRTPLVMLRGTTY